MLFFDFKSRTQSNQELNTIPQNRLRIKTFLKTDWGLKHSSKQTVWPVQCYTRCNKHHNIRQQQSMNSVQQFLGQASYTMDTLYMYVQIVIIGVEPKNNPIWTHFGNERWVHQWRRPCYGERATNMEVWLVGASPQTGRLATVVSRDRTRVSGGLDRTRVSVDLDRTRVLVDSCLEASAFQAR